MITLKFSSDLVPLIVSGEKNCTWRLWDDKNLKEDDEVTLVAKPELKPFARAIITSVVEKTMGQLTEEDKRGHESFRSEEEMYATYSGYYGKLVSPNTPVKVVKFKMKKGSLWGKQVQIFITDICNLACDGCPYPFIPKEKQKNLRKQELTPSEWKKVTDYLYWQGIRLFCLIGGEPASYHGLDGVIKNITDYSDAFVLLSTSGIHPLHDAVLRKKLGEALARPRFNKYRNGIAISFDAIPAATGPKNSRQLKAQQGLDFIKLISEEFGDKITYTANVMINPGNLDQVLTIQSFLEERNIFTNICTQQMKCFNDTPVFNRIHLPLLRKVALEVIKRKVNKQKVVNSVAYLSQLPGIVGFENYQCWQEPQGSPVLDFAPNGNLRYCNWIGQDGPDGTPSIDITNEIEGNQSLGQEIWVKSKKITKQLCQGCSWSRRDRNMPPMVEFNSKLAQLDSTLPELQNIWAQAQQS